MNLILLVSIFLTPCVLSGALTALLLRHAVALRLIDQPSERKFHTQPTPRGGGLAIYLAIALTTAGLGMLDPVPRQDVILLGVAFLVVIVGLLDDLWSLSWQVRLGAQFIAASLVLGIPEQAGWLTWLAALFWIVGLVNAFNMLDNMDALSAGTAWIAGLALLLIGAAQDFGGSHGYLIFLGAVAGFLWFNKPPARIFMGDAGSTFLGFYLGVRTVQEHVADAAAMSWAAPLCVLAVPWYDLFTVVCLRLAQRRSPFHADKQHLSHRLVSRGLSSRTAVCAIHGMAIISGLSGVLLVLWPGWRTLIVAALAGFWIIIAALDLGSWIRSAGLKGAPYGKAQEKSA